MKQLTLLFVLLTFSCSKPPDPNVQKLGSIEVTAQLTEIPGPFPSNDLYNYAYVFKYKVLQVHRGKIEADTIFVGQYNPLKPRAKAEDQDSGKVGGDVEQFRDILLQKGWRLGADLHYQRVEGAEHNEAAWAARVGPFLQFLFPAQESTV